MESRVELFARIRRDARVEGLAGLALPTKGVCGSCTTIGATARHLLPPSRINQ